MALFDIFSRRVKKKNKKTEKPKLIADIHEKDSGIIAELISKDIEVETRSLEVGDYIIGELVIERKSFSDFASSMLSRRLIEQLNNLKKAKKVLLVLEGYSEINEKRGNMNNNSFRGMILSIIHDWNIPIVFTKNSGETSEYLYLLAKRELKNPTSISLHSRIPKTKEEQKKYILEAFPGIGPASAEKLLKKFKSLNNIFSASSDELSEILGKKATIIKDLLD